MSKNQYGYRALFSLNLLKILKERSFLVALVLASIVYFFSYCKLPTIDNQKFFSHLIDLGLGIYPSLLGFSLGGFVLIITFGEKNIVEKYLLKKNKQGNSYYESMLGSFTWIVFIHAVTLLCTFAFWVLREIFLYSMTAYEAYILPFSTSFLFFLFTYSLTSSVDLVVSMFTFWRLHHDLLNHEFEEKNQNQ